MGNHDIFGELIILGNGCVIDRWSSKLRNIDGGELDLFVIASTALAEVDRESMDVAAIARPSSNQELKRFQDGRKWSQRFHCVILEDALATCYAAIQIEPSSRFTSRLASSFFAPRWTALVNVLAWPVAPLAHVPFGAQTLKCVDFIHAAASVQAWIAGTVIDINIALSTRVPRSANARVSSTQCQCT